MTKEQILDVLSRTDQQAMHGEGIDVTKADVVRLLEERNRLLEALTVAVALREGAIHDVNGVPSGMLRAAIAFAEEVAP